MYYMKKYNPLLTINVTLLTLGFAVYVLYIGASIIIPFVVAVLFSFMLLSISKFYEKLPKPVAISLDEYLEGKVEKVVKTTEEEA